MKEKPLDGIYRISFNMEVDAVDQLSLSDLTQSLTEGFGEGLLERVSHLSIEKVTKKGQVSPTVFKVGDKVSIVKDIQIKASLYEDDGYVFIGKPSEISNELGQQEVVIKAGSFGYINKISEKGIEVIDLDISVVATVYDENENVNIDFIELAADLIEKIVVEGDK